MLWFDQYHLYKYDFYTPTHSHTRIISPSTLFCLARTNGLLSTTLSTADLMRSRRAG